MESPRLVRGVYPASVFVRLIGTQSVSRMYSVGERELRVITD